MFSDPEQVHLLLGAVPVAADALKDAGAVVEGVVNDPNLRLFKRDDFPFKIG